LSDYVISSYAPTLETLLVHSTPIASTFQMLTVIQPEIQGGSRLPGTYEELKRIERHIPKHCMVKLGTPEMPTSIASVLLHLSNVSFAHFACHGSQDLVNPLDSALSLGDGDLSVSTLMGHRMPNASLAFLSACETAKVDQRTPDEAIHLSTAMLFAGFRGVVGTVWLVHQYLGHA
jgi:CHAT domain-containing protein